MSFKSSFDLGLLVATGAEYYAPAAWFDQDLPPTKLVVSWADFEVPAAGAGSSVCLAAIILAVSNVVAQTGARSA